MRMVFGVLSVLLAVAIVGVLARKQMTAVAGAPQPATATEVSPRPPQQQVQQVQKSLESALQQARPAADDDTK
jgi:hypothetical protein